MKNNWDAMDKPRPIRFPRETAPVLKSLQHSAKRQKFESFSELEGEEMTAAPQLRHVRKTLLGKTHSLRNCYTEDSLFYPLTGLE